MEVKSEPCDVNDIDVSNSSGSKDLGKTLPEEAFNNFLQGKRHMLVQDYSFAVQSLATACELYVKHFGELAIECGEVYFLYGKALFRLSQQQAGVLGGALNEGSNEEESSSENQSEKDNENESEKNSDREEGEENEAEGEGNEAESEENEAETEGNEAETEGNEDEDEAENEEKEPSESTDSPPPVLVEGSSEVKVKVEPSGTTDVTIKQEPEDSSPADQTAQSQDGKAEEGSEENQEVEEDDLELAWNTLETAKSIFKRKDTVEAQLKVADILLLLAEISMESDNNGNAINDLKECLNIQKKHLKPDDRILAETYYQMGLALMLDKRYPEALENFRETQKILELRRENLEKTPVIEADGTFAKADIEAEISDLSSILLDIKEKIDDTEELITNKKKELEESAFGESSMSGSFSAPKVIAIKPAVTKPVSNITHLLKRKKPEEASTSEDSAKRIKTSNIVNGESKVLSSEASSTEK